MSNPTTEHAYLLAPNARPRTEVLLPPAIILLVFAMVVIAIGGFAFVGGQQSMLGALRLKSDAMREAVITLDRTNASVAHVLTGDRGAMASYFRNAETLR